jgi:tripeptidyl-peptidase-1
MACRYHIPSKIQEHVDYITPGIRLHGGRWGGKKGLRRRASDSSLTKRSISKPHTQPRQFPMEMATFLDATRVSPLANCDIVVTPACLQGIAYILTINV